MPVLVLCLQDDLARWVELQADTKAMASGAASSPEVTAKQVALRAKEARDDSSFYQSH
jgi:hypothetical protein